MWREYWTSEEPMNTECAYISGYCNLKATSWKLYESYRLYTIYENNNNYNNNACMQRPSTFNTKQEQHANKWDFEFKSILIVCWMQFKTEFKTIHYPNLITKSQMTGVYKRNELLFYWINSMNSNGIQVRQY